MGDTERIIHEFKEFGYSSISLPSLLIKEAKNQMELFYSINLEDRCNSIASFESGVLGYYPSEREIEEIRNKGGTRLFSFEFNRARGYSSFDFLAEECSILGNNPLFKKNLWISNHPHIEENLLFLNKKIRGIIQPISIEIFDLVPKSSYYSKLAGKNSFSDNCLCLMRVLNYNPNDIKHLSKEHTDYEFVTLIVQSVEGLEIKNPKGEWQLVKVDSESAILLPGDMLEVVSNGYIRSSLHRVRCDAENRNSIIYFQGLPLDFQISYPSFDNHLPDTFGHHILPLLLRGAAHLKPIVHILQDELTLGIPERNPFRDGK